jgi:spermidine/putrescine-binding protein
MKRKLTALAFVVLNTFALSACSSAPTKESAAPKEAAKTALSEAAQQALTKAEADVKTAKAKFALWTTAASALQAAQEAAKAGESDVVIKQAKFVSDQVARGLAQLSYPTTEPK